MTAPAQQPASGQAGLLERLLAAVRIEFRADILVPGPDDPVLGRPNGYCGLPVQRQCPHANACLTCPVFITGPEFLPELRDQQQRTLTLITTARDNGHVRVTEMNEQVALNLDRMITELEATGPDEQEDAANAG
jgi:hypothetical protein